MQPREMKPGIYWVGAADWDRRLFDALRPKLQFAGIIGSYGWGGKTVEQLAGMIPNLKVEILGPVLCKGLPGEADFKALEDLAETIAARHKEQRLA